MSRDLRIFIACITVPALLLLPGIGSIEAAAAPAAAGCTCDNVLDGSGRPLKVVPGKQPVLLVHGMGKPLDPNTKDGTPGQWDDEKLEGKSLAKQLGDDANYVVGRLDYSKSKYKWVTDKGDSPDGKSAAEKLAVAISCMAQQSGKKVIVVGHSMGGLATQAALQDPKAQENVAGIVSVATPWQGTRWLPLVAGNRAMEAMRKRLSHDDRQGQLSLEMKNLKPIPAGIPVLPVAGVVTDPSDPQPVKDPQSGQVVTRNTGAEQRVNLIETDVNLIGKIRRKIVAVPLAHGTATGEGFDPWVGENSALQPPMQDPSKLLKGLNVVECKREENPTYCYRGFPDPGFHSALPFDPKFAELALPTIQRWRESNAPSSGVGAPGCAVSKAVKRLPVTITCTGNDVLIAGKCVERVEPRKQVTPPKPVVPLEEADPPKQIEPKEPLTCGGTEGEGDEPCPVEPEEEDGPSEPDGEIRDQVCPPECPDGQDEFGNTGGL